MAYLLVVICLSEVSLRGVRLLCIVKAVCFVANGKVCLAGLEGEMVGDDGLTYDRKNARFPLIF